MKILLVGDYPRDPRLGSSKVFYKLKEEFEMLGHSCDVLFSEGIGARPYNRYARQALGPVVAARAIARLFRERGPYDVVDVASAEGAVFGAARLMGDYKRAAFVSRSNGLEQLNYQRMIDDDRAGLLRKPWTRRLWYPVARLSQVAAAARLADKLILLNEADRKFALDRKWKRADDVVVVRHGISDRFLREPSRSDAKRGGGILFCGSWDNVKGVAYLAQAFSAVISSGIQVNLTVLGGGVAEEIIRSAFPAGIQDHITVVPRASEDEVMRQYRKHDAFVFCSTYEGFGMVLVEAMSQQLPVIATPVGCAAELVKDQQTGLVVPPRNVEALAHAMRSLLNDPLMRVRLADNAFELVRAMTWRNTALKTLDLYASARRGN